MNLRHFLNGLQASFPSNAHNILSFHQNFALPINLPCRLFRQILHLKILRAQFLLKQKIKKLENFRNDINPKIAQNNKENKENKIKKMFKLSALWTAPH